MIRRWYVVVATTAVLALVVSTFAAAASASAPKKATSTLRAGASLLSGSVLRSPNGRFTATMRGDGRLVLKHGKTYLWSSRIRGEHPRLKLRASGNLAITSGSHLIWSSGTAGSRAAKLVLRNDGVLTLRSSGGTVWTNRLGNTCRTDGRTGKRVTIDLSKQFARLCSNTQQVLTTAITSGATAYGNGTPTGTWHLQGKQRDRYLYPAAGGAYYVHYWMPYDGDYGMHDSSWQRFAYGSAKYRTQGSHGCVHFPHAAIAWMYAWAPIGTTVSIHS